MTRREDKDMLLMEKRFVELSRLAYQREIITYSDFLNLNEQNILHSLPKDSLYTRVISFGGYEAAERQMVAFVPDALYLRYGIIDSQPQDSAFYQKWEFPFTALVIAPQNRKFAENLSHRDYLGAILNLGIDRAKTGDIIQIQGDAVIFVHNDIASFVAEELTRVRHTTVKVSFVDNIVFDFSPEYEEIRGTVASVRLDSLLPLAFSSSRSRLSGLIEGEKVFVNGKLITSNGYQVKEGDIISVRGMGKFRYDGAGGQTRKKRISVTIRKYK